MEPPRTPYSAPQYAPPQYVSPQSGQSVRIVAVEIPFWDLVVLILKVMLASIPAIILFYCCILVVMLVFGTLFAGCMMGAQPFLNQ